MRDLRFNDDTTVIVIDALPTPTSNFPTIALQVCCYHHYNFELPLVHPRDP